MALRSFIFVIVLVLGSVSLVGCEQTVGVDPPTHSPRLVVDGFFTPDSVWQVILTRSVPAFDSLADEGSLFEQTRVAGADVTITTPDGTQIRLQEPFPGAYRASDQTPTTGSSYVLEVSANGFPKVQAADAAPAAPRAEIIKDRVRTLDRGNDVCTSFEHTTTVRIRDRVGQRDDYQLAVSVLRRGGFRTNRSFETTDPVILTDAFASDITDQGQVEAESVVFSDALFAGESHDIQLRYYTTRCSENLGRDSLVAIQVRSLSRSLERYIRTVGQQQQALNNPISEPTPVESNVSGGFGIFGGFSTTSLPVRPSGPTP